MGTPFNTTASLVGIPRNTLKAQAHREGWPKDADHLETAERLKAGPALPCGAVPVATDGPGLAAAGILRSQNVAIAMVAPEVYRDLMERSAGERVCNPLILKELGVEDRESSGEELAETVGCERERIMRQVYVATPAAPTAASIAADPKSAARKHAENAGRAALKLAAKSPPPIKTWRDLEIAAKLAGVAGTEGTKDQPLINISLLNDPAAFAKPVRQTSVRQADEDSLELVEAEEFAEG